jgi:hypothetical protein
MSLIGEASEEEGCQSGNDQEDSGDLHTYTYFCPRSRPAVGAYPTLLGTLVPGARQR